MATKTVSKVSEAELVSELGALQDEPARRKFLTRHKFLLRSEVVKRHAPLVVEKIRVDAKQALLLSEGTLLIARRLRRKEEIALALRDPELLEKCRACFLQAIQERIESNNSYDASDALHLAEAMRVAAWVSRSRK